ncbi:MAG: NADH-quinone oxidoreductase subunit K, partial [Conexivisphaera sp.]
AAVVAFGIMVIGMGAYGLTYSRNLVRQLLSVEVAFNGLLMTLLPLLSLSASSATYFGVVVISVVSAEVIVVVAVLISYYRASRSLSSDKLEEVPE